MKPHERVVKLTGVSADGTSLIVELDGSCECFGTSAGIYIQPFSSGNGHHVKMECLECGKYLGFVDKAWYELNRNAFKAKLKAQATA